MDDPSFGKENTTDTNPAWEERKTGTRRRYILHVTIGYAVFAAAWIFLSDSLLTVFVDPRIIQRISTAKGILFVLVTSFFLFFGLRGVPDEAEGQTSDLRLESIPAVSRTKRPWIYLFAVMISVTMLVVRSSIMAPAEHRSFLILFMLPITLSAMASGLGPGLVATFVTALGAVWIAHRGSGVAFPDAHTLLQWWFLVANGVLVSILAEWLHQLRQKAEASHQLQLVTLASIGDGVITTDTRGSITFLNQEAERLTGWSSREARGLPLTKVYRIVDEQSRQPLENPAQQVLVSGRMTDQRSHTVLLCRDGRELPVQDSGAPLKMGDGRMAGAVLAFRDDTRRRQAELVLQQERELLKNLVRSLPDLVWLKNPEGVYLACNPRFERFFGSSEAEIVGKTDYDYVGKNLADLFVQRDGEAIAAKRPVVFEQEVTFADDGHREVLEAVKTPMFDLQGRIIGVLGIARDVTESKRARESLRRSEATYRSLFENMLNGFAYCRMIFENDDPRDFVYLSVNAAFEKLTGLYGVTGRRVSEVIPGIRETSPDLFEIYGRVARGSAPERFEIFVETLQMWFSVSVYCPGFGYFVAVFDVITKRKRAEEALRKSLAEKIALLKEVHHRVKNNLQIVASLLNLQADRTASPEARAALLDTRNRVHSMALLHEVLYRSEDLAWINLASYVEELCIHLLRSLGPEGGAITVEHHVEDINLRLEQAVPCGLIINELVTNAFKYGFPDERKGTVVVTVRAVEGSIDLSVRDDGRGLPADFDPLASASLGLRLVINLAGQLGGRLTSEKVAGGGVRFRVNFPYNDTSDMSGTNNDPNGKETASS